MAFLDQCFNDPDIHLDIYFSTWVETATANNLAGIHLKSFDKKIMPVTNEIIQNDLRLPVSIQMLPLPDTTHVIPMIQGWLRGRELVERSGQTYDYIYLTRPDLFYDKNAVFDFSDVEKYKTTVGFPYVPKNIPAIYDYDIGLTDISLFTSYENFLTIISDKLLDYIKTTQFGHWHAQWYYYITEGCNLKLATYPTKAECLIARYPIDDTTTYKQADEIFWRFQRIASLMGVGIYGDFGLFEECRPTMKFLDQAELRLNIVCNSYDMSVVDIPNLNFSHKKAITSDYIDKVLKTVKSKIDIAVLDLLEDEDIHYRELVQMQQAFEKINATDVCWYYLFTKANTFFHSNALLDPELIFELNFLDKKAFSMSINPYTGYYTNSVFFASCSIANKLITPDLPERWKTYKLTVENNFEKWWHSHVVETIGQEQFIPMELTEKSQESYYGLHPNIKHKKPEVILPVVKKDFNNLLVIFDLDGVLIESKEMHYTTLNQALSAVYSEGIITEEEQKTIYEGIPTRKKLELLTKHKHLPVELHDEIYKIKQEYTIEWLKNLMPNDTLRILFETIKKEKGKIAVASNSIRESVKNSLLSLGLMQYVDYYISNEDVTRSKPYPDMYWKCMSVLNFLPKNTIILEDSLVGKEAVRNSGAHLLSVDKPTDVTLMLVRNFTKRIKIE